MFRLQSAKPSKVQSVDMAILIAPSQNRSLSTGASAVAQGRRRRPRAWLLALAFASFLAPCHAPIADAASSVYPFFCTLLPWSAG